MQKLTLRFQNFKKSVNHYIVQVYRECKEICSAAERGDQDCLDFSSDFIKDETYCDTNDKLEKYNHLKD